MSGCFASGHTAWWVGDRSQKSHLHSVTHCWKWDVTKPWQIQIAERKTKWQKVQSPTRQQSFRVLGGIFERHFGAILTALAPFCPWSHISLNCLTTIQWTHHHTDSRRVFQHFNSLLYSGGSSANSSGPWSAYHWVPPPVQRPISTQELGDRDGSAMFGLQTSIVLVPAAPEGGMYPQHLDQLCQRTIPSIATGSSRHCWLLWRRKSLVCLQAYVINTATVRLHLSQFMQGLSDVLFSRVKCD